MTTSTGHEISISSDRKYLTIAGDLATMQSIPEGEIEALCAAEGLRCTWEAADATSYRVVEA